MDEAFRFKQFKVSHMKSSMKVGVDSVLLGAWASKEGKKMLDVGTGCGLLSLMIAQRNPEIEITAIDIDEDSIDEARQNFKNSLWNNRIDAFRISFQDLCSSGVEKYDLIISNPPYFNSGVTNLDSKRKLARHQGELTPELLIRDSRQILSGTGKLSMILPSDIWDEVKVNLKSIDLSLARICHVFTREGKKSKRILLEFSKDSKISCEETELILKDGDNKETESYLELCKDFYINF